MLRTAGRDVHLHVFGPDAPEADRRQERHRRAEILHAAGSPRTGAG
jgi:hypothetical protein